MSINTLMHNVFLRCPLMSPQGPLLSRCPPSFISLHLPPSLCPSLFRVWDEQSVIVERPQHTARDINTHFSCSCQNKGPYEKETGILFLWHPPASVRVYFGFLCVVCTYSILRLVSFKKMCSVAKRSSHTNKRIT